MSRRSALDEQVEEVLPALGMVMIMVCIVWFVLPYVFAMDWLTNSGWCSEPPEVLNIIVLCGLVLGGMVVPTVVIPRTAQRIRERHYAFIAGLLKDSDASQLLLDTTRWDPIYELAQEEPLVRLALPPRPAKLVDQIELAADYWRVMLALTKGNRRKLRSAIFLSRLSRSADKSFLWLFNGCIVWLVMILGGIFMFCGGAAVLLPWAWAYMQNLAAEQAMLDYFLKYSSEAAD